MLWIILSLGLLVVWSLVQCRAALRKKQDEWHLERALFYARLALALLVSILVLMFFQLATK